MKENHKSSRWTVLAGALIVQVILGTVYAFSVFVKPLEMEFGWDRTTTQWAFSIALLTFAVVMIPAGRLQDRIGPRKVASIGGILLGNPLCAKSRWSCRLFRAASTAVPDIKCCGRICGLYRKNVLARQSCDILSTSRSLACLAFFSILSVAHCCECRCHPVDKIATLSARRMVVVFRNTCAGNRACAGRSSGHG